MKVRFAVAPGGLDFDPARYIETVDALEEFGFDTIWLSDIPLGSTVDPVVGLSLAAGRTTRLKLGANIVPLGRNPMLLAKELAQLDGLSGGRLLISLVPGLGQPAERDSLGVAGLHRGDRLDTVMGLLRAFWGGEAVTHHDPQWRYDEVRLPVLPVQVPLELWLGGSGPQALDRVGRLADGWLGAAMTPPEARVAVAAMHAAAVRAGRTLDPEHFGMSIPYGRLAPDEANLAYLRARRPDTDPWDLLPVGADALRSLLRALADAGLSKFVLRPVGPRDQRTSPREELEWLADVVLPLQT